MSNNRKTLPLVLVVLAIALTMVGCGGSSSSSGGTKPSNTTIAFQATPPKSITIIDTTQLTAVVSNDPDNYGVDWSLRCVGSGDCGSLSAPHTASGDPVTYVPNSTFSGNSEQVNIVAFATADHTKNVLASMKVTGFAGQLSGTFTFHAKGANTDPGSGITGPYQIAGVVVLDGSGGVKIVSANGRSIGGEQTMSNSGRTSTADIVGGNYSLNADGRGTLTLRTNDSSVGVGGTETFTLIYVSSSKCLLAETDGISSASGSLDLQSSSKTVPAGGYAFALSGTDGLAAPIVLGGVFNVDDPASGTISGIGSLTDVLYQGFVQNCPAPAFAGDLIGLSGTVSKPDDFGAVQFNLTACFTFNPLQFTGYVIDSSQIALVETDVNADGAGGGFATGGLAIAQAAQTGQEFSFSGNYVYAVSGIDGSGINNSLTAAGILTADTAGDASGTVDQFSANSPSGSSDFFGSFSNDASGIGRIDLPISFVDPSFPFAPEYIIYQTASGKPQLMVHFDAFSPAAGTGILYPSSSAVAFSGKCAAGLTQATTIGSEGDFTGQWVADPTAKTITGVLDGTSGVSNASLTGTFDTVPSNGRFAATLAASDASGSSLQNGATVEMYLIDNSQGVFVETDFANYSLGYFHTRTSICPTCP